MNIYEKNLKALGKRHPDLVKLIEAIEISEDTLKILRTESGDHRVLYKKDDGEEIYIHNAHDPAKCANEAIGLLGTMGKEGIIVIFGFGLGYIAEELLKRFEKGHIMLVYEAIPAIFKAALMTRDISDILASDKVDITLGDGEENLSIFQEYQHLIVNGKFWIVRHHPSVKLNEKAYKKFQKRLEEERLLSVSGIATTIGLGKEFINAFMENIPHIMRKPGVDKLKDMFKGRPAIVVAAGPSLEKNIHLLKKAKGRAVVIAVDAALPSLLPAGIVPDLLVAVDPEHANIVFFKDNLRLKDVPFVCLAQYAPNILDIYPGPMFINAVPGNIIFQLMYSFWEEKGFIEYFGGSVSHLAFAIAEYVGADTIALIGQDLSYTKNMHAGDVNKLLHDHHNPGAEYPNSVPGQMEVKNIFDEKRYTTHSFKTFKISFEKKIKTFSGTVVHATEDGVPIEGTQVMRLSDFINEYCDFPELDTFSILSKKADTEVTYNLEGLYTTIKGVRGQFKDIKKNAEKVLKYIYRVIKLKKNGQKESQELHDVLEKIENLTEKVKHPILNIITHYHYGLELYLKQQDVQDIDEIEDKWERLDKQLERGQKYYTELIEEISIFSKQLSKLIKNLKREKGINSLLMDNSVPDIEKFRKIGNIYKTVGIASQAVKYFELAIDTYKNNGIDKQGNREELRSQLQSLKVSLCEMYMKQFRFYEARQLLVGVKNGIESAGKQSGIKQKNPMAKINQLIKVCDEKISAWGDRKEKMGNMVKDAESNYGGFMESGKFYFMVKDYERAEKAYLEAIKELESNSLYGSRGKHGQLAGNGQKTTTNDSQSTISNSGSLLVDAYYALANLYLTMNKPEKSVDTLARAIEAEPNDPNPYCDIGRIAFQNNNIDDAEIFFKKAIDVAPNIEGPYRLLAGLYVNMGEREKATSLYENATILNHDNPKFLRTLAEIYREAINE